MVWGYGTNRIPVSLGIRLSGFVEGLEEVWNVDAAAGQNEALEVRPSEFVRCFQD